MANKSESSISQTEAQGDTPINEQLVSEVVAMAGHALSTGLKLPPGAIQIVEQARTGAVPTNLDELTRMHGELAQIVAPKTPGAVLALSEGVSQHPRWKSSSYLAVSRSVMTMTVGSLVLFILLSLAAHVLKARQGANPFAGGWLLLADELLYLSAAALGACFSTLSRLEQHANGGTFDPKRRSAYWTRLLLGVIAGFLLPIIVGAEAEIRHVDKHIGTLINALLALLGGFSASVVYRILTRLVETLESTIQGGLENVVATSVATEKSRAAAELAAEKSKWAAHLMKMQQALSTSTDPQATLEYVRTALGDLLSGSSAGASAATATQAPVEPTAPANAAPLAAGSAASEAGQPAVASTSAAATATLTATTAA